MHAGAFSILPKALQAAATLRDFRKGDVLFAQGSRPLAMHCVLRGEVRLVRTAANGSEIVLQRAMSGFVAEASLDQTAYHCDARVIQPSSVLSVPIPKFQRALSEGGFRDAWLGYVTAQLRRSRQQCERLLLHSARERVLHFIETEGRHGELRLGMTKKAWAAELGLTHEALYRTLRTMLDDGGLIEGPSGSLRTKKIRRETAPVARRS